MINEAIKSRRKTLGLSQQKLAQSAHISLATLQNIEAGKANPAWSTLVSIMEILGLEIQVVSQNVNWDQLVDLGLPLMVTEKRRVAPPSRHQLIYNLNMLPVDTKFYSEARQKKALLAFLWAIKDHYPSVWKVLSIELKNWWQKNLHRHSDIQLRRISLSHLGRYL